MQQCKVAVEGMVVVIIFAVAVFCVVTLFA